MIVEIIRHFKFIESKCTQKILIYNCNTALKHINVKTGITTHLPSE